MLLMQSLPCHSHPCAHTWPTLTLTLRNKTKRWWCWGRPKKKSTCSYFCSKNCTCKSFCLCTAVEGVFCVLPPTCRQAWLVCEDILLGSLKQRVRFFCSPARLLLLQNAFLIFSFFFFFFRELDVRMAVYDPVLAPASYIGSAVCQLPSP